MAVDRLEALRAASAGLVYQSENDAPFQTLRWVARGPLSEEALRSYLILPSAVPVTVQSAADFFAPMTEEQDWFGPEEKALAERFRKLAALLENGTAFRVGGKATVAVYILSEEQPGIWTGLATRVTET